MLARYYSEMKLALRALLLLAIFAGVGLLTAHIVLARYALHNDAYAPEARLAAMMAGLFAGGASTVIAGIAISLTRRSKDL